MIVRMSKYTLVLYHKRREELLRSLQELGLVDITSTGWEPDDREHAMILSLERHKAAAAYFRELAKREDFRPGKPFADGGEAFEAYVRASDEMENLRGRLDKARREAAELAVWGEFSPETIRALASEGITLRFFSVYANEFPRLQDIWGVNTVIEKIAESEGSVYFVVVQREPAEIPFDAQEHKMPEMTAVQAEARIAELEAAMREREAVLARAAASADMIAAHGERIKENLDLSRANRSGESAAEDTLVIMEGWATAETSPEVDRLLDGRPDVVYFKERPKPHDNTPVVLKNRKFVNPFEFIGDFYSLPRYGSLDLTAFFGPFYMIFFGFALGDAGYGLVLVLAGFLLRRMKGRHMKQIANLTFLCGGAAVAFGLLIGSFFGINLGGLPAFRGVSDYFLTTDNLFYIALWLGVVQIFFGLVLKVINTTRQSGFKYSLGTVGWMMILPYIVTLIFGMLRPEAGYHVDFSSPVNIAVLCAGAALMLLFHNPDKKPWANIGGGLWNTYNDVTGFLGDFLSYIRLFALCLAGGTLAVVFNDLAVGLAPDIPVVKQFVVILILVFGHGVNLFMSGLGAFVHPMRLTFVEFYRNAGFEATQRVFDPLKKATDENKT